MRYFLIFYKGESIKQGVGNGNICMIGLEFPNSLKTHKTIKCQQELSQVVVTSILELTKTDYDNWLKDA